MRATSAAAAVCSVLLLVACGTNARKKHVQGPAQQIADTITALEHDLLTRNWSDVCEQVFTTEARAQAGNESCVDFVRSGATHLRDERIRITSILVQKDSAAVKVVTTARGQAAVHSTIRMQFENGRYRVSALAQ
jgi:major membrane immunogen (membrane-anchored lipoprotein)